MWKRANPISLNPSSILDLKSEVLKTKEETKRKREEKDMDERISTTNTRTTDGRVQMKKSSKKLMKGKFASKVQDQLSEAERLKILERKSKLYEKLAKGGQDLDINEEDIMVDFDQKYLNDPTVDLDEDYVEITDEFGRTRSVPQSEAMAHYGITVNLDTDYKKYDEADQRGYHMFPPIAMQYAKKHIDTNEAIKEKLVRDEEAEDEFQTLLMKASKIDRFDHSKEKTRPMGVGFYQFASEDEERQEQMKNLKELRSETEKSRSKLDELKAERRRKMQEKMGKVMVKKKELEQQANNEPDEFLSNILTE